MRLDSHHHLWSYNPDDFAWIERSLPPLRRDFSAEEFEAALRGAGYDGSIAIQARQSLDETRYLLQLSRSRPFLRGVVGWVDLRSPHLEAQLDEFQSSGLVGARHVVHDEPDGFLNLPEVRRGLGVLERRGLAFDLLLFPRQLGAAASVAADFPRLQFVLDHLGKPLEDASFAWTDWRRDLEVLAECPNVAVKASGIVTESFPSRWNAPIIRALFDTVFEAFGPERVLASSNWPFSELAGTYSWTMAWLEQYLEVFPSAVVDQVLGGNAARVYRLDSR